MGFVAPEANSEAKKATESKHEYIMRRGLSAEKNVVKAICKRTGKTTTEVRAFLFSEPNVWKYERMQYDRNRYYSKEERTEMITRCVVHFALEVENE